MIKTAYPGSGVFESGSQLAAQEPVVSITWHRLRIKHSPRVGLWYDPVERAEQAAQGISSGIS
ncbi:MAG: hypothetical protein ACOYKH_10670 [Brevefilum fermentans]|uniref:hypothetical protein n=1 Tax=Candidatus Brevifilum fermentans TaxID=1986204 RepID=UPI0012FF9E9B|nr:hypothetical protein [Brevefilum fermentans]MDI9565660.1 hypothetical protein [Chloroflexota bacterium]